MATLTPRHIVHACPARQGGEDGGAGAMGGPVGGLKEGRGAQTDSAPSPPPSMLTPSTPPSLPPSPGLRRLLDLLGRRSTGLAPDPGVRVPAPLARVVPGAVAAAVCGEPVSVDGKRREGVTGDWGGLPTPTNPACCLGQRLARVSWGCGGGLGGAGRVGGGERGCLAPRALPPFPSWREEGTLGSAFAPRLLPPRPSPATTPSGLEWRDVLSFCSLLGVGLAARWEKRVAENRGRRERAPIGAPL